MEEEQDVFVQNILVEGDFSNAVAVELKGKVIAVNQAKKTATIEHDEVAGYMVGMTMDFPIHADWAWDELTAGSEIKGDLVVDSTAKEPYWIEKIGIVAAAKPSPNGHGFNIDELLKVKKLAHELGGTAKLKELATALAKLV